ncbi:PRC-barrel domain-containing protein [Streptomyces sp. C10-9-1]|uniref:PRC-barrel domain-containing protein n=1 Tax=Streptomyces sp. C10-9-1 TaxID=1859285 RepID=UPI003D70672B
MLFTRAQGEDVVELSSAATLGTVTACTLAPSPARISGLRLKTRGRGGRHMLAWKDVESFGPDAVTVRDASRLHREKEIETGQQTHPDHDPIGKPVLTEAGVARGTVLDIEFDEQTGRVSRLLTAEEQFSGDDLVGVGGYAVVVGDS